MAGPEMEVKAMPVTVEVFRTNVPDKQTAEAMLREIQDLPSVSRATIDLDDCDRVLRIEQVGGLGSDALENLSVKYGCSILELEG